MRRAGLLITASICCYFLLTSCEAENYVSRKYPCSFVLNTALHLTCKLVQALDESNHFTKVSVSSRGGVYQVNSSDNYGNTEVVTLTTDKENYAYTNGIHLGAGNLLIIGQTSFNGILAYDGTCPNCNGNPELSWTNNATQVKCDRCGRVYDLNTGGIVSGAKDENNSLMRYIVAYSGRGSVLNVHN